MWVGWVHRAWRFGHAEALHDWVPKWLNADQKRQRCQSSEQILEFLEWRHSASPCPKKFRVQKFAGKIPVSIFWDQDGILPLIIVQRAKLSTRNITDLRWRNWRTFLMKNAARRSPKGLVLARQCPGSPGTCNPEETGLTGLPMFWSPTLCSGSGPVRLPPVPWTEKKIERSPFFVRGGGHCCRGDLVGRTTIWIFLSGLQKLECIELRGEYVE